MAPKPGPAGCCAIFPSALGWMGVSWTGSALARVTFGHRSQSAAKRALISDSTGKIGCQTIDPDQPCPTKLSEDCFDVIQRLAAFAAGNPDTFLDVPLDLSHLTDFQREVVSSARNIGYGKTRSYADVAARAGSPRAARAVGNVMRTNRFPLIVPCHRVVGAAGGLGGYSAPDGLRMKERLLRMEAESVLV